VYSDRSQNYSRNWSVGTQPGNIQPGRHLGSRTSQTGEKGEQVGRDTDKGAGPKSDRSKIRHGRDCRNSPGLFR